MVADGPGASVRRHAPTQAVDALDTLLRDAVRGQLMADVPLGAFLSGGVDSSAIVALMQAQSSRPVRTFTIGVPQQNYDEAEHARAVARHLGTDHTELYVTPQQALDVIPRLPALYDEPFADSSQIPTFLVSQMTRQHVTVALSGDGGDELFGGYNRYVLGQRLWKHFARVPRAGAQAAWASALTAISPPLLEPAAGSGAAAAAGRAGPGQGRQAAQAGRRDGRALGRRPLPQADQPLAQPGEAGASAPRSRSTVLTTPAMQPQLRQLHRPHDGARPADLPARRHPGEGRPRRDGRQPGDARAAAGPSRGRVRLVAAAGLRSCGTARASGCCGRCCTATCRAS